jgi:putative glutamine amidotransferase
VRVAPPRILLSASRKGRADEYRCALSEAQAEPLLIVPGDRNVPSLNSVAGLVLTGGGDVDPALYGGNPKLADGVDRERDELETRLLREAREGRVPTLCICRGLQLANVAFGGSLIGDIPGALGVRNPIRHQVRTGGVTDRKLIAEHEVTIREGSLLARIVGVDRLLTGSRHHQAVDRAAGDLRVVARTDDGVIEALEATFDSPFWLAVQWHPESTRDLDGGASRALFSAFVQAALSESHR